MLTGNCLMTLNDNIKGIKCIKKVSNDKIISSSDCTIKLWSLTEKKCIRTFSGHRFRVNHIKMITDDCFLSCSNDDTIRYWNIESDECLKIFKGNNSILEMKLTWINLF